MDDKYWRRQKHLNETLKDGIHRPESQEESDEIDREEEERLRKEGF